MSKLTTSLQAAVVIAAVAAPGAAEARPMADPPFSHSDPTPATVQAPAPPPRVQRTMHQTPAAFDWGDAALGAGATLLIAGTAGATTATLRTRRRLRPHVSAS